MTCRAVAPFLHRSRFVHKTRGRASGQSVSRQQAVHKTASDKIQLLQKKACKKGANGMDPAAEMR